MKIYCQRDIEDESICEVQCDHCNLYYAPLKKTVMRRNAINHNLTGIYRLSFSDGKMYIGQTRDFNQRKHCFSKKNKNVNYKLLAAFAMHGYKTNQMELINELPVDVPQLDLDNYEKLYISQYEECGIELLNIQKGGINAKHEESSLLKISKIRKGVKHSSDVIEQIRAAHLGTKKSDECKRKISQAHKGKKGHPASEETKKRITLYNQTVRVGVPRLESTKEKLRLANNKKVSQYTKEGFFIKEWISVKEAQLSLNIYNISWCANGKAKTAGGFIWKY